MHLRMVCKYDHMFGFQGGNDGSLESCYEPFKAFLGSSFSNLYHTFRATFDTIADSAPTLDTTVSIRGVEGE